MKEFVVEVCAPRGHWRYTIKAKTMQDAKMHALEQAKEDVQFCVDRSWEVRESCREGK